MTLENALMLLGAFAVLCLIIGAVELVKWFQEHNG